MRITLHAVDARGVPGVPPRHAPRPSGPLACPTVASPRPACRVEDVDGPGPAGGRFARLPCTNADVEAMLAEPHRRRSRARRVVGTAQLRPALPRPHGRAVVVRLAAVVRGRAAEAGAGQPACPSRSRRSIRRYLEGFGPASAEGLRVVCPASAGRYGRRCGPWRAPHHVGGSRSAACCSTSRVRRSRPGHAVPAQADGHVDSTLLAYDDRSRTSPPKYRPLVTGQRRRAPHPAGGRIRRRGVAASRGRDRGPGLPSPPRRRRGRPRP